MIARYGHSGGLPVERRGSLGRGGGDSAGGLVGDPSFAVMEPFSFRRSRPRWGVGVASTGAEESTVLGGEQRAGRRLQIAIERGRETTGRSTAMAAGAPLSWIQPVGLLATLTFAALFLLRVFTALSAPCAV